MQSSNINTLPGKGYIFQQYKYVQPNRVRFSAERKLIIRQARNIISQRIKLMSFTAVFTNMQTPRLKYRTYFTV